MAKGQAVDQRIVEMKFDNADFESKVGKTLETLTKLREQTKMEDAGEGMKNLAKGVKEVDLSRLADGIEQLNQRFSAFGIMGQQVVRNLTNSLMGLGKQFVDAVTSAPKGGFQTYESFVSATKQLKNSAKDAEGLPVTLEAVNNALDDLNTYSDKTIYSFNDMTANIGKFTNAGVNLEDSVTAIKGISNVAASAGASAQNAASAMYNFGQALGTGVVKLIDWRSINNANMGTIEFKNQLIQTAEQLGTLTKVGDKYISATYKGKKATEDAFDANSKFEDSLQQQWMTSEVLIETLRKYANSMDPIGDKAFKAATEVNTFGQMMSVFAESQKTSWSKVWRYIFGDYEESKNMWTGILGELNKATAGFFDSLTGEKNGILRAWHERGGYEDMIEGFKNLWTAAQHFLDPIKDLVGGLFPKVTADRLLTFTKDFRTFAEKLAYPFKEAEEGVEAVKDAVEKVEKPIEDVVEQAEKFKQIQEEILQGKWGNGQERIDRLTEAGYEYSNLQNAVNETLGATKRYETTMSDAEAVGEQAAKTTKDQAEEQKNYREEIKKSNDEIFVHKGAVENIAYIFLGVSSAVKTVVKVVDLSVKSFKKLSGGVGPVAATLGVVLDVLGNLGRHIYNFNAGVQEWLDKFNDFGGAIEAAKLRITGFFNTNKDGSKTLGITNNKLDDTRHFLLNIVTVLQTVRNKITGFYDTIHNKLGDSDFLVDLRIALNELGRYVGGALLVAFNQLAKVFNSVYGAAKALWAQFKNNDVVKRLVDAYKEAKEAIKGFFDTLKNQSPADANGNSSYSKFIVNLTTVLSTLTGVLGKIGTRVFNLLSSGLSKLNELSQKFFGYLANAGILDKVTSIWEKFKATFKDLPKIVDNFFNSIKGGKIPTLTDLSTNLAEFVEKIKALGSELKSKAGQFIGGAFDNLVSSIANIGKLQLPESLRNLTQKIASAFGLFGDTTSSAAKTVGDFIHNVLDKLKGIDLKQVAITGLIGSVALFVARWSKVGKNGANALQSLATFIKNGGKAATDAKEKFNGFLKIGIAIALIAASVWLLAQVPADRFKECALTLLAGFLLVGAAVLYFSKAKIDENRMKGIGIAFAGIGASLVLFAAAVKAFSSMVDDPNFIKGLGLVVVAMVSMVGAIKLAGPVSEGAGKGFAGLAAGVLILAVAVKAFAAMSPDTLIKGGIAVEAFMFSMAAAMKLAGNVSADGFMGLAGAIVILAVAVKMLAGLRTDKLVKGEIAVIALVVAMALASRSAKDVDGEAFKAMGKAIKILATAMFVLSKIPLLKLVVVTASLVIVFKTLTDAANQLKEIDPKESGKIALALFAMLVPIGLCLGLLATFAKPDAVLEVAIGLAAVLWALSKVAPAIEVLSKIKEGAGKAIFILDGLLVSIAAIIGVLLFILGSIEEAGGDKLVKGAHLLGEILHALVEGFIFGDEDPSEVLNSIGKGLEGFADKIGAFIESLQNMDGSVAENAKNLATAILAICAAEVLEALTGWIAGKSDFSQFGQAISSVTQAIMEINEAVSGEGKTFDHRAVKHVIECVNGMVEIANALPKQGGLWQRFFGHQDLGEFAEQLAAFVKNGFRTFVASVNLLGDSISIGFVLKVDMIKRATKSLVELANDLPSSGFSIKSIIFGNQDLGKFASDMAKFMNGGFTEFVDAVRGLPADFEPSKVKTVVVPAAEAMIELGKKLKENTSILTFFTGKSDLGLFGSAMASFSTGVKEFVANTTGFRPVSVNPMIDCIERLAELNASDKVLGLGLSTFSDTLIALGHGLTAFYSEATSTSPDIVSQVIDGLTNLHNIMLILSATDYGGMDAFTAALANVATSVGEVASAMVDAMLESVISRLSELADLGETMSGAFCDAFTSSKQPIAAGVIFVTELLLSMGNMADQVKQSGSDTADEWVEGFGKSQIYYALVGMAIIEMILGGVRSKFTDIYNTGGSAALKFCTGLTEKNSGFLKGAGKKLVSKAIEGINEDIDDFYDKGEDAADGFRRGIHDKADEVAKEAANMVTDAIEAARKAQDSASPSKKFRKLGNDGGEGYGLGFTDLIGFVVKSVTKTGNAGIFAMRDSIEKMNDMIGDEIDYQPTITPVLDLSQLNGGMKTTRGLIAELNSAKTSVQAAVDISTAHNESLAKAKARANRDYSGNFDALLEKLTTLNETAKKNKTAVIDGDYLYGYMDRRMGMAY